MTAERSTDVDERQAADEGKKAERDAADAMLLQERLRADAAIETQRQEHDAGRDRLEARRHETDHDLSTERSGADVALDDTKNALAHSQDEYALREDVFGMVTHDLRGALCVISVNAQNIVEATDESTTLEAAREMLSAVDRMDRLLTDLTYVSQIERGTLHIAARTYSVGVLLAEVLHSYRPLFAERAIAFTVEAPIANVLVSIDHGRMVQVLSNLLANALKFTPAKGTVRLHVDCRPKEVEFVLQDSGPGIPPSAFAHLFERFWQLDGDAGRGVGLGLYICEKIIKGHGGRIWAESEVGKGATFRFTLPVA